MSKKSKNPRAGRKVKLNDQAMDILKRQREAFVAKFGREPGPSDPVFFEPDADVPQQIDDDFMQREIVDAMGRAGIRPELIYAYKKTGVMLTRRNESFAAPEDRAAFDEAIDEYLRLERQSGMLQ